MSIPRQQKRAKRSSVVIWWLVTWLDLVYPIRSQEAVRSHLKKIKTNNKEKPGSLPLSPSLLRRPPHHRTTLQARNIFAAAHTFHQISVPHLLRTAAVSSSPGPPATLPQLARLFPDCISGLVIGGEGGAFQERATVLSLTQLAPVFCLAALSGVGLTNGGRARAASPGPVPISLNLDGCICERQEEG